MEKQLLFEKVKPGKALAVMALPTVASQLVVLLYNLADTWFIGRTDNPYMIGASSLALTIYLVAAALSNVFGVGGGSLMARLLGEKKENDAKKVVAYSIITATICSLVFSVVVLIFMEPLLKLLGASENTLEFGKQYAFTTVVLGSVPTVLSMCMPQFLRNAGYSKEAGLGVILGSLLNIGLDPLFMFVILPEGYEVLGAGIATLISNIISFGYFVFMFKKLKEKTVLVLPFLAFIQRDNSNGISTKINRDYKKSLYSVGIPAAFAVFLFDLVTIVINRLASDYGDITLASAGIVLKLERIPINIGLGVCLGMIPLLAYNYGSGDHKRLKQISNIARNSILIFSAVCAVLFWFFAEQVVGAFISDEETIRCGVDILKGRCFSLPFMMIGYHIVNYMNAVNRGQTSFLLAIIRHLILIIPIMLLMNSVLGMDGLIWSQLVADAVNSVVAIIIFIKVTRNKSLLTE